MKFEFLQDSNGEQSSKRLFVFILIILFTIYFFADLFFKLELKQSIEDNLFWLIVTLFTGVAFEKPINKIGNKLKE